MTPGGCIALDAKAAELLAEPPPPWSARVIASTWLDLVVGLDIHFEMVPMPAPVPTPFPHPFVGMAKGGSFKGPCLSATRPPSTGWPPRWPSSRSVRRDR